MSAEVGFKDWMRDVNRLIVKAVGLSYSDLPDVSYYDMYTVGTPPDEAAFAALEEAGAPEDILNSVMSF
jgi:hypothetical protein